MYILTYIHDFFFSLLLDAQFSFCPMRRPSHGVPVSHFAGRPDHVLFLGLELIMLNVNGSIVSWENSDFDCGRVRGSGGDSSTSVIVLYTYGVDATRIQKVLVAEEFNFRNIRSTYWDIIPGSFLTTQEIKDVLRQCIQEMQPKYIAHNG